MSVRIQGMPTGLSPAVNRVVLAHLQDKPAHSDIATELAAAVTEALSYLDRSLEAGLRPGMGHVQPDRLFWAHDVPDDVLLIDSEES